MSDEEILLEYETVLADQGKPLKECPECGYKTHREGCPECDIAMTGDRVIDSVFAKLDAGEQMSSEEFEAALRGQEWEPINLEGSE